MSNVLTFQSKDEAKTHPLKGNNKGYSENILTPVKLSGHLLPWSPLNNNGNSSEYKLVCSSGLEYFIVADANWLEVLERLCYQDVRVIGLLNVANMTLIPQKIFPKGPNGEVESVVDLAAWKAKKFITKLVNNINKNVVIPVAVLTWMTHKTI